MTELWKQPIPEKGIIEGMREQAKGLKFYVESEYAPLKACTLGNPSGIFIPDPELNSMEAFVFVKAGRPGMVIGKTGKRG